MTQELTTEQKVDIIQKQTKLYHFLLAHPELQEMQMKLYDEMAGLSPMQRCIKLTTRMRQNQLILGDKLKEIAELSKEVSKGLTNIVESLKKEIETNGGNTDSN